VTSKSLPALRHSHNTHDLHFCYFFWCVVSLFSCHEKVTVTLYFRRIFTTKSFSVVFWLLPSQFAACWYWSHQAYRDNYCKATYNRDNYCKATYLFINVPRPGDSEM